jgi:hypothetical protein
LKIKKTINGFKVVVSVIRLVKCLFLISSVSPKVLVVELILRFVDWVYKLKLCELKLVWINLLSEMKSVVLLLLALAINFNNSNCVTLRTLGSIHIGDSEREPKTNLSEC